jgi:hypothetical protein
MSDLPRNWDEWKTKYQDLVQSQRATGSDISYEWEFAGSVLRFVSGLPASRVIPQQEFVGENGQVLHMDFGIEVNGHKIAIEVEGFDKTGSKMGKTKLEHNNWAARQRALQAQGWKVIAITNKDFLTNPVKYRVLIEQAMTTSGQLSDGHQFIQPIPQPVVVKVEYEKPPLTPEVSGGAPSTQFPSKTRSTGSIVVTTALVFAAVAGIVFVASNSQSGPALEFKNPLNPDCGEFASRSQLNEWAGDNQEIVASAFLDGDGDGQICESFQYSDD